MTLEDLRTAYPSLFYGQNWFDGHTFMDLGPGEWVASQPEDADPQILASEVDGFPAPTVRAVDLATLYVRQPGLSVWKKFLWTDDVDDHGCRVYVAGLGMYGCEGFQIHRHLQPECYWVRLPG